MPRFKRHSLKIKPVYLDDILSNKKTFEIRNNEGRDFKVGDRARLSDGERWIDILIQYITDYEQKPGYVVFSFVWYQGGKHEDA